MALAPYLFFDGNCREAFEFYRSVFGGEFEFIETFAGGPPDMQMADEDRDSIMHVSLPVGGSMLIGSDMPSSFGGPVSAGSNFAISVDAESRARADEIMAKLSEGGATTMPMQDTFWGAYFGSCADKYGVNWQVHYSSQQ